MSLSKAEARKIALSFPGAVEKTSYGSPAIFIGKTFFTRLSSREPDTIMLRTASFEERDMLIESGPETFFITDHFRDYKGCLARITKLDAKTFRALLERRWQQIAPKKLKETPGAPAGASRSTAGRRKTKKTR